MKEKSILRFNKANLENEEKLPTPKGNARPVYHDDLLVGLLLRVSSARTITFFVQKRDANNRVIKSTIGRYPTTTIPQAREIAIEKLNMIVSGINPNEIKQKTKDMRSVTLGKVFGDYLSGRGTNLKDNTKKGYLSTFNNYLADWAKKPIVDITGKMVQQKHSAITKSSPTRANTVMRHLRAYFNFAINEYENNYNKPIFTYNPVAKLSHLKAWNRESKRQTVIKTYNLKPWYEAIVELPHHELNDKKPNNAEICGDLFLFILFTGLRRREASTLKWTDIDFNDNSLTIQDTKNHEDHSLPLTDFLLEILERRKSESVYVFQGTTPDQPLNDPKKQLEKVRKISGVYFNLHDLRRTFITIAESLDINTYALKKLLNHKDQRDVTGGYIITDMERLREPMNKVTDYILNQVNDDWT